MVLGTVVLLTSRPVHAQRGAPAAPPPTAKAAAALDVTGYWVAVVSEDWRYRMVTPTKGDYNGIPLNRAAATAADAWDAAADEKAGLQCRAYGAAAIMRVPGRLHITWDGDDVLKVETDAGTQVRLFKFGAPAKSGARSWQGDSVASWEVPRAARGRGGAGTAPVQNGSLKVVTTNLLPGYLRKNGVPYSENATVTEYFSVARLERSAPVLVVTTVVDDPAYLTQPYIVSSQFKRQTDSQGWEPGPCSASW
jgi:hypothetical protein